MRRILAAMIAISLAQPVAALSCLRPTVASGFGHAQDSSLTYVLATGRLTPLPGEAIPVPRDIPEVTQARPARLDGHVASPGGFDHPVSLPIRVETYCVGPWCGTLPEGKMLFFLEKRGDAHVLLEGPCPRFALSATPEALTQAMDCLTGSGCGDP